MQDFIILNNLGDDIKVPVRLSTKAKRIGIRINHNGAELIIPPKHYEKGYDFLLLKESWVRRKLRNVVVLEAVNDNEITMLGVTYSIQYLNGSARVNIYKNTIEVYSKRENHKVILLKFLHAKFLSEVTAMVLFISTKHGLRFSNIRVMENKTRWGSCSSKGELAFNWRLIFAPQEVLKYLVVHEMCHLIEMNHSERFWQLVETLDSNYRSAKLWLKQNGSKVRQYLV